MNLLFMYNTIVNTIDLASIGWTLGMEPFPRQHLVD
jgi:hypothetical protein